MHIRRWAIAAGGALTSVLPLAASAQGFVEGVQRGVDAAGSPSGLSNSLPLETVIGGIINTVVSFLGVLLLGYLLYAGFTWMTAGGDKTKTQAAMTMIRNAIIGLIIIAASYAITVFVLSRLAGLQSGTTVK